MKQVLITTQFTVEVPDGTDTPSLSMEIDTALIEIMGAPGFIAEGRVISYETVNCEDLTNDED